MKNKFWFGGGLLLLSAALCFTTYNLWDEKRAEGRAEDMLLQYQTLHPEPYVMAEDKEEELCMPAVLVDDSLCIGTVEIPALDLVLPVMRDWNYDNLKIAPCRYAGSVYEDNLIIAGHNYRRHFGGLRELKADDEVVFTDVEDNRYAYRVTEVTHLSGSDMEGMESGEWDLVLFTCTVDSQSRVTVRCIKEEGS